MKNSKLWFILILLCGVLITVWFGQKSFLAGGEESFFLWNPLLAFKTHVSPWSNNLRSMGFYLPRLTLIGFAAILQNFGFSIWLIQAFSFLILLVLGASGVWMLVRDEKREVSFFASLFYIFNLYSFSQVWGRFIYNGIFAWALLPWTIYLFNEWNTHGRLKYIIYFLTISTILSHSFGNPAFILAIWIPVGIIMLFNFGFRSLLFAFAWGVTNFWWIYPELKNSISTFSSISDWRMNFDSLRGVSQYFSTGQILLLKQRYLFGVNNPWFDYYNHKLIWVISILILLIAMFGWLKSYNIKAWKWLTLMALIGWFISKGTTPPFGYGFYHWLFSTFPFMGILRNSYEKFGIVWLLPYSVFFAFGLANIKPRLVQVSILILVCGVLVWPMWTGDIFKDIHVKVPEYYKEANDYLNKDRSLGRILMLPIVPGDGVRYSWGYQGIEPSEFLFDKQSVSKMLRIKQFDDKYFDLYHKFTGGVNYEPNLRELNIKYFVLHNDMDSKISGASSSAQVIETLSNNPRIKYIIKFGDLDIYQYNY